MYDRHECGITKMVVIRVFDGKGNIKRLTLESTSNELSISNIKEFIHCRLNCMADNIMITSTFTPILYKDSDLIKKENAYLLAFVFVKR